jgi:hypothetical protein
MINHNTIEHHLNAKDAKDAKEAFVSRKIEASLAYSSSLAL